uniref:F-box associated beta-propeller type 3 domain-containing protein n=1 Tax=Oryza punctata TaxID=4537 RepID=A0A0E0KXS2_ORYPU
MASDESSPPNAKRLRRSPPSSTSPALTSDYFILAHRARAAAARHPELLFFAPPGAGNTTTFYACSLRGGEPPAAARELLTIDYFSAKHAVMSPTPCRGLTLVSDGRAPRYYLLNLSTGDHVALPPCQPAAELDPDPLAWLPGGVTSYLPSRTPWDPFELSTTGLGFDTATGEHKVVRLFKKRNGEHVCEVYTLGKPGGWRPCVGRVPASAANFLPALPPVFVNGYLYWLLRPAAPGDWQIRRILSFSVGAEQFGSVYVPPRLSSRMRHLANLDGSLCAVFDNRIGGDVYGLFTCSEPSSSPSPSWSVRCSIYLQRLPREVSDELMEERVIVPLCTAGGKILLATGHHKVFAYDAGRNTVERVFRMQEFVHVPHDYLKAPLLLNIGLHDECIADVHNGDGGERMLHVNMGRRDNTVVKREVTVEYHDDSNQL